jgi:hypothetical protein
VRLAYFYGIIRYSLLSILSFSLQGLAHMSNSLFLPKFSDLVERNKEGKIFVRLGNLNLVIAFGCHLVAPTFSIKDRYNQFCWQRSHPTLSSTKILIKTVGGSIAVKINFSLLVFLHLNLVFF